MSPSGGALSALALQFALLSMLAFGGANAVVPEIHRQAVEVHRWASDPQFTALFAISQAAPGPNFMISTLVGWSAAGVPGAVVATMAMCGPSCVMAYWGGRLWDRFGDAPWRRALASGLAPVTVGLVAATFWLLARAADTSLRLVLVTAVTAALAGFTRLHPLALLGAAGGLGLLGFL